MKDWLAPPDAYIDHNRACAQRYSETGLWFLQGSSFLSWLDGDLSFLWLTGFAGCGKSILCSSAIERTLAARTRYPDTGIAFYYFSFADTSKQGVSGMLRALIFQLTIQCEHGHQVLSSFRTAHEAGQPSDLELCQLLRELTSKFQKVCILLDALDEVPEGVARDLLLDTLTTLRCWKVPTLHVFATSRNLEDIRMRLKAQSLVEVVMKNVEINEDIARYVNGCLDSSVNLQRWRNEREYIQRNLTERCDGGCVPSMATIYSLEDYS